MRREAIFVHNKIVKRWNKQSKKENIKRNVKCKEICNGKEFQLLPLYAFGIQRKKKPAKERTQKEIKRRENKIKTFIYKEVKEKQFNIAILEALLV